MPQADDQHESGMHDDVTRDDDRRDHHDDDRHHDDHHDDDRALAAALAALHAELAPGAGRSSPTEHSSTADRTAVPAPGAGGGGERSGGEDGDGDVDPAAAAAPRPSATGRTRVVALAAVAALAVGTVGYGAGAGWFLAERPVVEPVMLEPPFSENFDDDPFSWYGSQLAHKTFRAEGLGTEPGTAVAYAYDPTAASAPERRAVVAAAFGFEGEGRGTGGQWQWGNAGGPKDLILSGDSALSVNYWSNDLAPACPDCERPSDAGERPSFEQAAAELRRVLDALGVGDGNYRVAEQETGDDYSRTAVAQRVVDGHVGGTLMTIGLVEGGVLYAHGQLADPVSLGEYPVVSEAEALERLNDTGFGAIGWVDTSGAPFYPGEGITVSVDGVATSSAPDPGTPISWPVYQVELISVRLGLGQQTTADGRAMLVPAYEFTDIEGRTWSVIAVAEEMLDLEAEPAADAPDTEDELSPES